MSQGSRRFMRCDRLWTDARLATMAGDGLGIVEHGVLAAAGGAIFYAGAAADAPAFAADTVTRCDGRWITPGLIDCHTLLVTARHRARAFEMRVEGACYADIARARGG